MPKKNKAEKVVEVEEVAKEEEKVEVKKIISKMYRGKIVTSENDVIKGKQKLKQIVDQDGTTFLITPSEYADEVA